MKILLTGGAGYIGTHTCVELCETGHEPIIVDNFSNSCPEAITRTEKIVGHPIPYYEADVCDRDALSQIFRENKIDAVIHFAGLKAVGESCSVPLRYYRNNIDATLTLCEVMKEFNVRRLVFSSSATVYSIVPEVPYKENMTGLGCTNPYGWTKFLIERILEGLVVSDPSWSVVLLRYFNPVGAHSSGLIGEDPSGIPNNLMPYIAKVAVGKLEKLHVFGNDYPTPDGTGVRDYLHVTDLARGHLCACDYAVNHTGCEIFNLGTGIGYSVLDMVRTFSKVNGIDIPYVIDPRRPGDIAICYADPSKAASLLGWKTEKTLEDMCRDTYRFQKANPDGYRK